jgi:type II secretory pathway component PulK
MKARRRRSESGVVLLIVMSGILVLTLVVFALSSSVRVAGEELANRKEHLQAYYLARGGIFTTAALLTEVSTTSEKASFHPGQRSVGWVEGTGRVDVEITDENGKIDLNWASETVLERLLSALGSDLQSARSVATAIVEWRNPSSLTRWGSAVASSNLLQFDPSQPAKIDYRSVEELLNVPGVTPELFYGHYVRRDDGRFLRQSGLIDCVTVDSGSTQININYAPYPVLLALTPEDPRVADYIVAGREKQPFHSTADLTSEFPVSLNAETLSALTTQDSGRYSLLSSGRIHGGTVARIQAVVNVLGVSNGRFQLVSWKDFYAQ